MVDDGRELVNKTAWFVVYRPEGYIVKELNFTNLVPAPKIFANKEEAAEFAAELNEYF